MADYGSLSSPTDKYRKPTSSIFTSPRLFTSFSSKGFTDTESVMSPTSILDTKPFSALKTPFWSDTRTNTPRTPKPENKSHRDKLDSRGVVLGLVDALTDEKSDPKISKPETRMILFGSQLKIQIPPLPPSVISPNVDPPMSPGDFGIKTRNSQLGSFSPLLSPSSLKKSPFTSSNSGLENSNSLWLGLLMFSPFHHIPWWFGLLLLISCALMALIKSDLTRSDLSRLDLALATEEKVVSEVEKGISAVVVAVTEVENGVLINHV